MLRHETQADEAAPVLADEGQPGQPELVEQCGTHPLHVTGVGVVGATVGLVGATEAHQVGSDDPEAGARERFDHLPVQVAPRRLAVHEKDLLGSRRRALVDVVHPEGSASVPARDVDVMGGELEVGQALEALVGRAEHVHGLPPRGGAHRTAAARVSMVRRHRAGLRPSRSS